MTQVVRQNRAMASVAYHMITSTADYHMIPSGRYKEISGIDEFAITECDHFVLAACGHTRALASVINSKEDLLKDKDECAQTLLYISSISGFHDMCELLLEKGAPINVVQFTCNLRLFMVQHTTVIQRSLSFYSIMVPRLTSKICLKILPWKKPLGPRYRT